MSISALLKSRTQLSNSSSFKTRRHLDRAPAVAVTTSKAGQPYKRHRAAPLNSLRLPPYRHGLRALGLSSAARLPSAPEILPLAEVGVPGFDTAGWGMVVAPVGTPSSIITRLFNDLSAVLAEPKLQKQIVELGMVPANSPSPSKLQEFINSERLHWGGVVQEAGLAGSE